MNCLLIPSSHHLASGFSSLMGGLRRIRSACVGSGVWGQAGQSHSGKKAAIVGEGAEAEVKRIARSSGAGDECGYDEVSVSAGMAAGFRPKIFDNNKGWGASQNCKFIKLESLR